MIPLSENTFGKRYTLPVPFHPNQG